MSSTCVFVYSTAAVLKLFPMWLTTNIASWVWAMKPYVGLTYHSKMLWYLCNQLWTMLYDTFAVFIIFLSTQPLPSCFSGPRFLIAANNCHNYVPSGSTSVNDFMFKQVEGFFFPACFVCDTSKEIREIKAYRTLIIFSPYWIKTNTNVSLIRFQQMSCFIWRCIPGLAWNNLIPLPGIMPLYWLIFSPGYFSCISLGMVSSTSTPQCWTKESGTSGFLTTSFEITEKKNVQCVCGIIFLAPHLVWVK